MARALILYPQGLGQVTTGTPSTQKIIPTTSSATTSTTAPSATPYIVAGAATTIALGLLVYLATR